MTPEQKSKNMLLIAGWIFVLSVSDLPYILFTYLGVDPASLPTLKLVALAIYLLLCWMFQSIRPLWQFAFVFLVFQLANILLDWIFFSDFWQTHFNGTDATFAISYLSLHTLDILRALLVIAALWIVKRNRADFYLVKGQWDAPIEPVRWLGIKQGESWRVFGWIFAACAGLAILIPLAFSVPLTTDAFSRALPYLPIAMVLAGMNAFAEESYFRASVLSTLANVIGKNQALLLSCLFFGLGHYFGGSPPGIVGVALTGFLAFLLGKSMLETKGMLWAWIIHWVPDVFIFFSYVLVWQ